MSAALAGVDSMTVTPFDKTYDAPNEFSERMARNQQLLLKEESHFDKVIDPAAGSYYIENLTVSIAKQAWDLFLAVEEDGGFYASVKAGKVQAAVNESNKARMLQSPSVRKCCWVPTSSPTLMKRREIRNRLRLLAVAAADIRAKKMFRH